MEEKKEKTEVDIEIKLPPTTEAESEECLNTDPPDEERRDGWAIYHTII